jgi:hypothetical protein
LIERKYNTNPREENNYTYCHPNDRVMCQIIHLVLEEPAIHIAQGIKGKKKSNQNDTVIKSRIIPGEEKISY